MAWPFTVLRSKLHWDDVIIRTFRKQGTVDGNIHTGTVDGNIHLYTTVLGTHLYTTGTVDGNICTLQVTHRLSISLCSYGGEDTSDSVVFLFSLVPLPITLSAMGVGAPVPMFTGEVHSPEEKLLEAWDGAVQSLPPLLARDGKAQEGFINEKDNPEQRLSGNQEDPTFHAKLECS
ncbi:hypothetical protein STEG23_008586, partial [Scotinomys teguina]